MKEATALMFSTTMEADSYDTCTAQALKVWTGEGQGGASKCGCGNSGWNPSADIMNQKRSSK